MKKKIIPKLEIVIASDLVYDCLVAEIYCNGKYVALISQDEGPEKLKIVFPDAQSDSKLIAHSVDFEWFTHALDQARNILLGKKL